MPTDPDTDAALDLISKRIDFLEFLDGDPKPKREIADELGYSRSTVNRTITELSDAGLVADDPGGCQTTFVGSVLADQYHEYVEIASSVLANREVLATLSLDSDIPPIVLKDANVRTPRDSSPYGPYHAIEGVLERSVDEVQVYVPTFTNPRGIELARTLAKRLDIEIVFGDALIGELRSDIPNQVEMLSKQTNFTGYRTSNGPKYSLILTGTESGMEGAVVIHSEERELVGCIVTDNSAATEWMEQRYAEIRADSEPLYGSF